MVKLANHEIKSSAKPTIRIEVEPSCWICGQEIKEGELFVSTLKKNAHNFYHASCWKAPESHGWMV